MLLTPGPQPERARMEGRLVNVVPLEAAHAAALFEGTHGADQDAIWRYMAEGPFPDLQSYEERVKEKVASQDPLFFAIVDRASGLATGIAAFLRIFPASRTIEVGHIVYTPRLRQTAGATEAMYLMARYVFEDLGYRRYEWKCNSENEASRRAALRLGFQFEGIFRQHMIVKGKNRDTAWFAMLDGEWPERKRAFEQWLAPENFDQAGVQRRALSAMR